VFKKRSVLLRQRAAQSNAQTVSVDQTTKT